MSDEPINKREIKQEWARKKHDIRNEVLNSYGPNGFARFVSIVQKISAAGFEEANIFAYVIALKILQAKKNPSM